MKFNLPTDASFTRLLTASQRCGQESKRTSKREDGLGKRQVILGIFFIVMAGIFSQDVPVMRISVENTDSHTQTIAVQSFAQRLQERTAGTLDVQVYSTASLVRDSDAVRAMALGNAEMAVPGTWHIDSLVPEVGLFLLPSFYGAEAEAVYHVLDSDIGSEIVRLIEEDLFVKIPGRWIDLGHAHLFSTHAPIRTYQDIAGMRIRVAGGLANEARIEAMGGNPTTIVWADLPVRLEQRVVQGVLTTFESVRSAELWNYGIRYAYVDRQYFPQYIPMIAGTFWNKLSADLQQIIIETWEEGVDAARSHAAEAQQQARNRSESHGVIITEPDEAEIEHMRSRLLDRQYALADALAIPREMTDAVMHLLGKQ